MYKSVFVYLFIVILGNLYVVTLRKTTEKKTENNALWTIYVKYGLKIYREVWTFESGKVWHFEMENA